MAKVNHTERAHALLSASGASRWINCTPSARMEDKFPQKTSVFAEEGTLAHEFADIGLRLYNLEITEEQYFLEVSKLQKHKLFSREMTPQVAKYIDEVKNRHEEALHRDKTALLFVEEKLDFSHVVKEGFGTGDGLIVSNQILEVIDLKYGKGVKVDATDNDQLKLYGLGALNRFDLLYDISTVRLTVIQPRLDSVSTWDISVEDLLQWAAFIAPIADVAFAGLGEHKAGAWCRWCKAKAICRKYNDKNLEAAKLDFAPPAELSDDELIKIYELAPQLSEWAKAIASHVHNRAVNGDTFKGYKLVEGRSRRKWLDEEAVQNALIDLDLDFDDFMKSKLKGIGDISAMLAKDVFAEEIEKYIIKSPGKPALVKEDDERASLGTSSAQSDFNF